MDQSSHAAPSGAPPFEILAPADQSVAVVLASPHSGRRYEGPFLGATQLAESALRRSEDAYVDLLLDRAPERGAPLIQALFPRTFVDVNREPLELDPDMFREPLPWTVNRRSPRVRSGLGAIARLGASGAPIYDRLLAVDEARRRLRGSYFPYHRALRRLVAETRARFGFAILLDCHSMPSQAVARLAASPRRERGGAIDFVLGDCHGQSCDPQVVDRAEAWLRGLGYGVARNAPYAGGFTTRHYGRPAAGVHALQIEVNRALYLDEARLEPGPGVARLRDDIAGLIDAVAETTLFARAAE